MIHAKTREKTTLRPSDIATCQDWYGQLKLKFFRPENGGNEYTELIYIDHSLPLTYISLLPSFKEFLWTATTIATTHNMVLEEIHTTDFRPFPLSVRFIAAP